MKLMTLEVMKERSRTRKDKKSAVSKKIEYRLVLELKEKLEGLLENNDKTLLEVDIRYVGEFINILSDKVLSMYDYEQLDKNKFIFYTKEITF
jgi:hypothetical protein